MYLGPKFGPIPNGFEAVFFPKMLHKIIPNRKMQKKKKKGLKNFGKKICLGPFRIHF